MSYRVINPVLPGFYPSPSVCNANGQLYMVTSSFTYFPGLPIFTSKNGVSWSQIGNVISSPEQMSLKGTGLTYRLMAPTLRFYEGKFYCVCNQADGLGVFLVTAENPAGPWSKPVSIEGAEGDDPSLYFDDDGSVWYCGVRYVKENPLFEDHNEIYVSKINLNSAKLVGEKKVIVGITSKFTGYLEAPHIFMHDDLYYVVYSEGRTGLYHAVSVARAEEILGEWEINAANPVLTHRNMGHSAGVVAVGHGDIFFDKDNRWWLAVAGVRPYGEKNKRSPNMGRETFFAPVRWEDNWPFIAWETGHIENAYSLSGIVVKRADDDADAVSFPVVDDFNAADLQNFWVCVRERNCDFINCTEKSGNLRLYGGKPIGNEDNFSMVVRRQTGFCYEACTEVRCYFANDNDCAGIICYQNEKNSFRLQLKLRGKVQVLELIKTLGGVDEVVKEVVVGGGSMEGRIVIRIVAERQLLKFEYGPDERNMNLFDEKFDSSILAPNRVGGYSGIMIGMFAVAGGDFSKKEFYADFDWFKYENITRDWVS